MSVAFEHHHPLDFFSEDKHLGNPVEALRDYFRDGHDGKGFTGSWFDKLAYHAHPYQITAADIVAVSTLGIRFPSFYWGGVEPPAHVSEGLDAPWRTGFLGLIVTP